MKTPVYLDNNSTTPVDPRVIDSITTALQTQFGNASSTTHSHGWQAEELVSLAREQVAELIDANPTEIYFTSGATEANNIAILGYASKHRQVNRDTIISSPTEHRAVLEPLEMLKSSGLQIKLLSTNPDGCVSAKQLKQSIDDSTLMVSLMLGNNEIGSLNDVEPLAEIAREAGAAFHCDATQAIGKIPVSVKKLGVDFLSLSAHKFAGPKGCGALFMRKGVTINSPLTGGGQEKGIRPGTLNVPGIIGLGKACEISKHELPSKNQQLKELSALFWNTLKEKVQNIELNGPTLDSRLPGNLNISFQGVDSAALIGEISSKLSVSSTSACSSSAKKESHVLKAIGLSKEQQKSSIRIGIGWCNTKEEVIFATDVLTDAVNKLRGC